MLKLTILAIAIIAITSLLAVPVTRVSSVSADASTQPQMVGSQWKVYEENTLPTGRLHFYPASHADTILSGGVDFPMPDATSTSPIYVNYLMDTFTASLTETNTITATINVVTACTSPVYTSPCPTTTFAGNPDGILPNSDVRLYIQSNLPEDGTATCVSGHKNVLNYWWSVSPGSSYTFTPGGTGGTITLTAKLTASNWSGICGNPASSNPAGFDTSIANIKYVALSFGSGYFYANGMGVDGSTGTATFQLLSYTIS